MNARIPLLDEKGSLSLVDTDNSSISITQDVSGVEVVLSLDITILLAREGQTATIADLVFGDRIEAKYNPLTMLASLIDARIPQAEVKGTIQAINSTAGELTVKQYTTNILVTLQVDSSTIIRRGYRKIALSALRVGNRLEVKYNPLTLVAMRIEVK